MKEKCDLYNEVYQLISLVKNYTKNILQQKM